LQYEMAGTQSTEWRKATEPRQVGKNRWSQHRRRITAWEAYSLWRCVSKLQSQEECSRIIYTRTHCDVFYRGPSLLCNTLVFTT
jgi:hypothetical protein